MRPLPIALFFSLAVIASPLGAYGPATDAPAAKAGRPQSPVRIPDTPPGVRLTAFLQAMSSKDNALLRRFVQDDSIPAAPGGQTSEARVDRLWQLREDRGPFVLLDILDSRDDRIIALMKDRNDDRIGLRLEVEPAPPHRTARMLFGDPESLKERAPAKAYTNWKDLRGLIAQIRADNHLPAMAIAVARDEKHIEQAVVGVREQGKPAPAQINDRWHVGSVGKPMTATLIALLIDRGVLRWDTTLGEALPDVKMQPGYRQVTLEQLLQHRGGVPQDMGYRGDYIARVTKDAKTPEACRAAYVADVLQRAPIARPGERMAYSNAGYTIAGYVAEHVTRRSYEQLMREMVFLPLGMTTARVGGAGSPDQPQGHVRTANGLRVMNFTGKLPMMTAPAGDITCSIGDLARFAAFHLAGMQGRGRLLKPETFRRLHTPPPVPSGQEQYACGWEIVPEFTAEPFQGHGGSNGTFVCQIALFAKQGLAIVSATNVGDESNPNPPLQAILAVEKRYHR